jgi:hypothetical protein
LITDQNFTVLKNTSTVASSKIEDSAAILGKVVNSEPHSPSRGCQCQLAEATEITWELLQVRTTSTQSHRLQLEVRTSSYFGLLRNYSGVT